MRRPSIFSPEPAHVDEDARVTTIPTALERALQRHGDDLYRLALLLTPDESLAAAALRAAMPRLADAPADTLHEPTLIRALIAGLPPERRRLRPRRAPAWARLPTTRAEAPLVAVLARLPRPQRLALGLLLLRGFEPAQAAGMIGGDRSLVGDEGEVHIRVLARDALRALAPHIRPALALADLDADSASEACQPTRAALALGGDMAHADPAARGHLALCAACRAAEQTWAQLTTAAENALRAALRGVALPDQLAGDLRAAVSAPPPVRLGLLAGQRRRLAALAAVVLGVVALLVLPGRREPPPAATGGTAGTGAALAPHDMVARAHERLYTPPSGSGVWHGRWQMRWTFASGSYALLNADAWLDSATSRHRAQLTHQDGGGPFEFELADDSGNLWYATTSNYSQSIYPASFDPEHLGAHLRLAPSDQQQMLQARLESGAWDLATAYLRQAAAARDLRSWGRQRAPDGTTLDVLGFDGVSPLAPPADAPDQPGIPTTILLSIDAQSGALHEVRELIGPQGAERISRTTWRFVAGEWLTDTQQIAATFDLQRAWNGTGHFDDLEENAADPALPLDAAGQLTSLAQVVQNNSAFQLPSAAPAGASRAALLVAPDGSTTTAFYFGAGRRLAIRSYYGSVNAPPESFRGETIVVNGQQTVLRPTSGLGYRARLTYRAPSYDEISVELGAIGYTRAELLDLLHGFGPITTQTYRTQASLFADPHRRDRAAFEVLLGALADPPAPPSGRARHFVERTFTRHSPAPDPLSDPYHLPPYGGRPQELFIDNWMRRDASGAFESAAAEHDARGTIYGRQYLGPETTWYYDAPQSQANRLRTSELPLLNRINQDQGLVLDLLARGGNWLATLPDGTRVISHSQLLLETRYAGVLQAQQGDPNAGGPYLGDIASDSIITTLVYLGADGRPKRTEAWASTTRIVDFSLVSPGITETQRIAREGRRQGWGMLLEAWELVSDEYISADHVPPHTFDTRPPDALTFWDSVVPSDLVELPEPQTVTISDALRIAPSPLFALAPNPQVGAPVIETGVEAPKPNSWWSGSDPFEDALRRGVALRFTYWLTTDGSLQRLMYIYEGPAELFETQVRLRSSAPWGWRWQSSTPFRVVFEGRSIDGWRMTTQNGDIWTLFEADGTLVAAQTNDVVQGAALTRLQALPRP
jgi:hypothetical protein